jgi:hypothetical protein
MPRPVLTPLDGVAIVGTDELADLAVTNGKLATDAVTTAKIANSQVTLAKIAPATYGSANGPLTLVQRFSDNRFKAGAPVDPEDVVTKAYADALVVPGWNTLSMAGGWAGTIWYGRIGGAVMLQAEVTSVSSGIPVMATLPVGFRPGGSLRYGEILTSSPSPAGLVTIASNGQISSDSASAGWGHFFVAIVPI